MFGLGKSNQSESVRQAGYNAASGKRATQRTTQTKAAKAAGRGSRSISATPTGGKPRKI